MKKINLEAIIEKIIVYILVCSFALFAIFPIIWTVINSFKISRDIITFPPKIVFAPTLQNYNQIFEDGIAKEIGVSVVITLGSSLLTMLAGLSMAYVLARFKYRIYQWTGFTILSMRFVPFISILIPLLILYRAVGLSSSFIGLILAFQILNLPVAMFILRGFILDIPIEYEEAAIIDGASRRRIFFSIIIPLIRNGIFATLFLVAINTWNQFLLPLILGAGDTKPVVLGVMRYVGGDERPALWGQMAAWSVVVMGPMLCLYFFIQKYIRIGFGSKIE